MSAGKIEVCCRCVIIQWPRYQACRLTLGTTVIMFSKYSVLDTHVRAFRDPLVGRHPQFEKPCFTLAPRQSWI